MQLGTFSDHADAIKARTELALDLSDILHHDNRPLRIIASKRDSLAHVVFAQAFPTPEAATALCVAIQPRGPACSVTAVWPARGSDPHGRVSPKPMAVSEAMAPLPLAFPVGAASNAAHPLPLGAGRGEVQTGYIVYI